MKHFQDYYSEAKAMDEFLDDYIYDDNPAEVESMANRLLDGRSISDLDSEERDSLMSDVHQFLGE